MMRFWPIGLLMLTLAACTGAASPTAADGGTKDKATSPPKVELPNLGRAPELTNEVWLNTEEPLRLADLRGQVVLLDMWTFG